MCRITRSGAEYGSRIPPPRHRRQVVGDHRAAAPRTAGPVGRHRRGQQEVHQRRLLGPAHRRPLARPAARLRRVEERPPPLLQVEGQGRLGAPARGGHRRPGLRVAHDRRDAREGPPRRHRGRWRQRGRRAHKRGLNTKVHLAADALGMPVRFLVTPGASADCRSAAELIDDFRAEYLPADRAYDTEAVLAKAAEIGAEPVIPSKSNRRVERGSTGTYTSSATWWRTPSRGSSAGAASPRATARGHRPSRRRCRFAALHFGSKSRDDTA